MARDYTLTAVNTLNQSFLWMFIGLLVTGGSAYLVSSSHSLTNDLYSNGILLFGLIIIELVLVFFLSARIRTMSFATAALCFLIYSLLNGITLSSIFIIYTATSIAVVFLVSALVFGLAALFGSITKKDLTTIGGLAFIALIGIIVGWVVNIFLKSSGLDYILSFLAVIIFIGLTAYDTQKIKELETTSDNQNLGILGALMIYLDFINIFLNLLRLFGSERE